MNKPEDLGESGRVAWQAFLDMRRSKDEHFGYLEALEARYQSGGAPGIAEKLELEKRLAEHDRNVLAFKTAMSRIDDARERELLLRLMS